MKRVSLLVGLLAAALTLPALGVSAVSGPALREAPDSRFPDRIYILQLPERGNITSSTVTVTENGYPVDGLGVAAPGASSTAGVILLVDASNSMEGAPIQGAVAAAKAFAAERNPEQPLSIVTFNDDIDVALPFTTDKAEIDAVVAKTPTLSLGTHLYDALGRAAELAKEAGYVRTTVVLLSDGADVGSGAALDDVQGSLDDAKVRVIAVGLKSKAYDPKTLKKIAAATGGAYLEAATPKDLERTFRAIGAQLSAEYVVSYRSLLGPEIPAVVNAKVAGYTGTAAASYTTPPLPEFEEGTFESSWLDDIILSPWFLAFVVIATVALLGFSLLALLNARGRSMRRRMGQYVDIPSEEESMLRRTEVATLLADRAQRRFSNQKWWQKFELDCELAGVKRQPITIAALTLAGGLGLSILATVLLQSPVALLVGVVAPLITRFIIARRVSRKRKQFAEQFPENLEVLAGALRAGHGLIGAMNVMVEGSAEPSQSEMRRVLQDEQLGVPLDQALAVMARRMDSPDVDQVAIVTTLQRDAGGNMAEVLDHVVQNIRARQDLRRLARVLTAQGRLAWAVVTALPIFLFFAVLAINPSWFDPLFQENMGRAMLLMWLVMLAAGSFILKKMADIKV